MRPFLIFIFICPKTAILGFHPCTGFHPLSPWEVGIRYKIFWVFSYLNNFLQGIKKQSRQSVSFDSGSLKRRSKINETPSKDQDDPFSFTRHLSDTKPSYDHSQTGFLWSWNFMISRKWKVTSNTGATGDIPFMDKMLADFRAFCRNDENRLKEFWKQCWDTHNHCNEVKEANDMVLKAVDITQMSDF